MLGILQAEVQRRGPQMSPGTLRGIKQLAQQALDVLDNLEGK